MKKFFAIAAIAIAFTACNNSGDKKEETKDTTEVAPVTPVDTTAPVAPVDTTAPAATDSTAK